MQNSAWIVDADASAVLCVDGLSDFVHFNPMQLSQIQGGFVHIYPQNLHPDIAKQMPDLIVDVNALLNANLLSKIPNTPIRSNHRFYFNDDNDGKSNNHRHYQMIPYRSLVATISDGRACALSHAIELIRWHIDHKFCSRCGHPTKIHASEYANICPNCQHTVYPRIQPCIIVAIIKITDNIPQILLAQHHNNSDGMYGLIAGFMEIGESLEMAVVREVLEESNLVVDNIRYVASQPWPYPSNLMIGFVADYKSGELIIQQSELSHAQFFELDKLPKIPKQGTIARKLIEAVGKLYNIPIVCTE